MKKFLVVLLALAMVFAIATTAMAKDTAIPDYNDTTTSTEYANDVYRLTALGVLCGNTGWGGAYRPEDFMTRAEFAKIVCYLYGKQDYVNYYAAQQSAFSDVAEGNWAEGYINCANDNGLMIGVGGGKFAPNATVSKQEVATAVLRAVGYDDSLPGAWPADYIAKSQKVIAPFAKETLFDYVEIIDGSAATRAEMAAICNYALDLYRVAPAGNQLIVNGLSDADADGFLYKALKTNEADIYNFFLGVEIKDATISYDITPDLTVSLDVDPNLTTRETLLWDVFHAIDIPYYFERWETIPDWTFNKQYVEASGWGYEDFEKGELVFGDEITRALNDDEAGAYVPVASDYYIFDDSLDGELWQVGGRLAMMTVQIDAGKVKVTSLRKGLLKGAEAVYVEMLTDVNYIDEETEVEDFTAVLGGGPGGKPNKVKVANADLYSLDLDGFFGTNLNGNYDIYDYDWFKDAETAIVMEVTDDEVLVDNFCFGEAPEDGGMCCKLGDDCKKKHLQKYIFLKDGKLQDASCLELNDVIYFAGYLLEPDEYSYKNDWYDSAYDLRVKFYLVYTPKAGTFDEMTRKGTTDAPLHMIVSGDEYGFCEGNWAHRVSYNGGYEDGYYDYMYCDELEEVLGEDCLYTVGYGKKYVASLIIPADEMDSKYGVMDSVKTHHNLDNQGDPDIYFAEGVTMFGPDDEYHKYDTDEFINVGYKGADGGYEGNKYLGWLGNYHLNEDGEFVIGEVDEDTLKLTKADFGFQKNGDTGYVPLAPATASIEFKTTEKGKFTIPSVDSYKELNALIQTATGNEYEYHDASGMKITEDTIIFEITAKVKPADTQAAKAGEAIALADTANVTYKSVKLGEAKKYIDSEFTADQVSIFAWKGTEIKVLYVVNPHFNGDILFGLFDTQHVDKDGGFAYFEDGTKIYFTDEAEGADLLTDHDLIYGIYKTQDDKVSKVYIKDTKPEATVADIEDGKGIKAGDFIALVDANGFALGDAKTSDEAKAYLKTYTDGAYLVTDVCKVDKQFASNAAYKEALEGAEYIDMTGDGDFENYGDFHSGDGDYLYIFVVDEGNDILKVFRVNAKPAAGGGSDGSEDFISITDILGF